MERKNKLSLDVLAILFILTGIVGYLFADGQITLDMFVIRLLAIMFLVLVTIFVFKEQ